MKTYILIIFNFIFATVTAQYYGGDLTVKQTGPLNFQATLTTCIDTIQNNSYAGLDSVKLEWGDGTSSFVQRVTGPLVAGIFPNGATNYVVKNTYVGEHTYPGIPDRPEVITFSGGHLIPGILNLDGGNSDTIPLFLSDTIFYPRILDLCTPHMVSLDSAFTFLNSPVYYGNLTDTFTYNPAAHSLGGDSISYELADFGSGLSPSQYCQGIGIINNTFQLNAHTGQVTWSTPCAQGYWQLNLVAKESVVGEALATGERSMLIVSLSDSNHSPQLNPAHDTILQPGQMIQYDISSFDPDVMDTDWLQVLGGPFFAAHNPPMFLSTPGNPAVGTFTWQPDTSFASPFAYMFTVIATDNYKSTGPGGNLDPYPMADMKTFRVWVVDTFPCTFPSAIKEIANDLAINIYPNPATDKITCTFSASMQKLTAQIISPDGRIIISNISVQHNSFEVDVSSLASGLYFLVLRDAEQQWVRRFVRE